MDAKSLGKKIFSRYTKYYDLIYKDKNYLGEVEYIVKLISLYGKNPKRILEFGSGTGRHGGILANRGYLVHGIERSAEMAEQSPDIDGFSYQIGDIRDTVVDRSFDAVISLFHVVSYQTSNYDVHAVFANAAGHLQHGGLFLFDFWYSPALAATPPAVRVKHVEDERVKITRLSEPKVISRENRVDVRYTIFVEDLASREISVFEECHPMRHFSLPEIDLFCEFHGFERVIAEEFVTAQEPSNATFGVCVVARKI